MATSKYSFGSNRTPPLSLDKLLENVESSLRKVEENLVKRLTPPPPPQPTPPLSPTPSKINWENKPVREKLAELKALLGPFCVGLEPKLWLDDLLTYADQVKLGLMYVLKNIDLLMDTSNSSVNDWLRRMRPTIAFLTQKDADEKIVFDEFCELLQNAFNLEEMRDEARDKLERIYFKPGANSVDEFVNQVVDLSRIVSRSITAEQLVKILKVKIPEEFRPFVDGADITNEYVFKRKLTMIVNAKIKFSAGSGGGGFSNGGSSNSMSSVIVQARSAHPSPAMSRRQFLGGSNSLYQEVVD